MKMSANGTARNGMNAIKSRKELYLAKCAISALHDGLVGVLQGKISIDKAREFFCVDETTVMYGDVLEFKNENTEEQKGVDTSPPRGTTYDINEE